ncbi:hypothetical protein [Nostoc sp. TCL26-01]|nr:hypothetical protein [Nostoc sp. TCL26-01]
MTKKPGNLVRLRKSYKSMDEKMFAQQPIIFKLPEIFLSADFILDIFRFG